MQQQLDTILAAEMEKVHSQYHLNGWILPCSPWVSFQNLGVQLSKLLAGPCIGGRAGARSCSAGGGSMR